VARRLPLILFYLAVAALGLAILAFRLPAPGGGPGFEQAAFQPLDRLAASADEQGWRPVALPHATAIPGANRPWYGLYRFEFPCQAADLSQPQAVLIPAYGGRLQVLVNGTLLFDSVWTHPVAVPQTVWPGWVTIPAPLLRPGINRLELRQEARAGLQSYLGTVHVGPAAALEPAFRQRHLLMSTLPELTFAWEVAFALTLLIVWTVRRAERASLIFCLILLVSAGNSLCYVVDGTLLPETLLWLASLNFSWSGPLLLVYALSYVGRTTAALQAGLIGLSLAAAGGLMALPRDWLEPVFWYGIAPAGHLACAVAVGLFVGTAIRRGDAAAHIVAAGSLLTLCCAVHDLPSLYQPGTGDPVTFIRFAPTALLTSIAAQLMWRFARALNAVDRFNAQLRRDVAAAEAALRAAFARQREHVRTSALEAERARLTRDLHDGLAGQLVSIVALSSRGHATPAEFGAAARTALSDLRLVLASLADVRGDLGMTLANFRDQIEPQVRNLGLTLDWHMSDLPATGALTSSATLELFRLLQEATLNAARHSGADRVTIEITPAGHGVRIVVADRGCGGARERPGGHGLPNMHRRAQAIGGRLAIESGPDGTRVQLDLLHRNLTPPTPAEATPTPGLLPEHR